MSYNNNTRNWDPYLTEIDNVSTKLKNIESTLLTNANIQTNVPFVNNVIKPWNNDLLVYLDFSDSTDITKDVTGNNRNAYTNTSLQYNTDPTRTHCIRSTQFNVPVDNIPYTNIHYLDLNEHINDLALNEYSISCWYYPETASSNDNIWSFTNTLTNIHSHLTLLHKSGKTYLQAYDQTGALILEIFLNTAENSWIHIMFTNNTSGNRFYINGTLLTNAYYAIGTQATVINLNQAGPIKPNELLLCATKKRIDNEAIPMWPLQGKISDFAIWNRALSNTEVTSIRDDDYGYMCYILAGQSNMVGVSASEAQDSDYSKLNDKVFQYNAFDNIDTVAPYNTLGIPTPIIPATNPMKNFSYNVNFGTALWKTFCENLIQYGNIPFRKRVLLIPVAKGSTGFLTEWAPTLPSYIKCVNACNDVLNLSVSKNKMNTLQAMLWNQGEQSIVEYDTLFKSNFQTMINGFRNEIPQFITTLPIVFTEVVGSNYDGYVLNGKRMKSLVNEAYHELATENQTWEIVEALGKINVIASDRKHYTVEGHRLIGYLYYDAYCKASSNINRKPQKEDTCIVLNSENRRRDVQFVKPVSFVQNPTYTNLSIGQYITYDWTFDTTGGAVVNMVFTIVKLGNLVTLMLKDKISFTTISTNNIVASTMPTIFRPIIDSITFLISGDFDTTTSGLNVYKVTIDSGIMSISNSLWPTLNSGASMYLERFSITYISTP